MGEAKNVRGSDVRTLLSLAAKYSSPNPQITWAAFD